MKRVHFIGIKGVGMSALALVLNGLGYDVTGSDVADSYGKTGQRLDEAGIAASVFNPRNITPDIEACVIGASFGDDNVEVAAAQDLGIALVPYSEMLQAITNNKRLIAVSGTHGKTTTTSLITYLLRANNLDPSWIIGTTEISGLPAHGGAGHSDLFVVEADEYRKSADDPTPKFLDFTPYGLIVNNIEHDHPDVYPTFDSFVAAFRQLVARVRPDGVIVANGDDPTVVDVLRDYHRHVATFGFNVANDFVITHNPGEITLTTKNETFGPWTLNLVGRHNAYNAAAAGVMAIKLGVNESGIASSLGDFRSVERRFQLLGATPSGTIVIDDYAHHPTAIRATLEAARDHYPNRPLWVAFQSHTYTRTLTLLDDFAAAFHRADHVIITDIFASARESEVRITGQQLADAIALHHPSVEFVAYDTLLSHLKDHVPPHAVIVVMGASQINEIGEQLVGPNSPTSPLTDLR